MDDGRCNWSGGDVGPGEKGELRHARARLRKKRAAAGVAHDPKLRDVVPEVSQSPGLVSLDERECLVESREHDRGVDVWPRVLYDDAKSTNLVDLG